MRIVNQSACPSKEPQAARDDGRRRRRFPSVRAVAWLVLVLSPLLPCGPLRATEPDARSWQRGAGSVALLQSGQAVWQFNFQTNQPKPFFHPVALPGGPALTWERPPDHPWHHALWFSWKFINGINYWEEDAVTGVSPGRTEWRDARVQTRPDFSAQVVMDLLYRPADGDPVLTEHRVIEISPPDAQGAYRQDWTMTFTAAGKDLVLDRTPLASEAGGQPWGGYAGLSARFAQGIKDVRAVTTGGLVEFDAGRYRGKASALDYSGSFDQREAGIAILDHPLNLNSPSPWYAINDATMRYVSPAVLCYGPHTLKSGQNLTLRYRLVVHPGRWSQQTLGQAAKQFESAPP